MVERIIEIIAKVADCDVRQIHPESKLDELGIDSLKAVTLIFEIEETFDLEISDEDMQSIVTVKDILDKIQVR